jgi:Icc protein
MPVCLLHLSDIHFTRSGSTLVGGRDPARRLQTVLDVVLRETPLLDGVVVTGDLTDDGSWSACRNLSAALRPLGLPMLSVPGNHDDPHAVRQIFGPDVLELGGWRVVGIDSSRPAQIHGTVDVDAEMSRLDTFSRLPTVLAIHHPPVTPSTNAWFQLEDAAELRAAIVTRPHVRALFTGHLHHPFEADVGAATVFACPSSLIGFRHDGDEVVVGGADTSGARLTTLHDDGAVTSHLIMA